MIAVRFLLDMGDSGREDYGNYTVSCVVAGRPESRLERPLSSGQLPP